MLSALGLGYDGDENFKRFTEPTLRYVSERDRAFGAKIVLNALESAGRAWRDFATGPPGMAFPTFATPSRFTARNAPTISSVNAGKSARDRNSRKAAALRRGTRAPDRAN